MTKTFTKKCRHIAIAILAVMFCIAGLASGGTAFVRAIHLTGNEGTYGAHYLHRIGWNGSTQQTLFNADGTINSAVVQELMQVINSQVTNHQQKSTWGSSGPAYNVGQLGATSNYKESTAKNFSDYAMSKKPAGNIEAVTGAVVIKLFPDVADKSGVENGHITEFTQNSWFQLVYRSSSMDGVNDVLTLYAAAPYRQSNYNGLSSLADDFGNTVRPSTTNTNNLKDTYGLSWWNYNTSQRYTNEGNYSNSIIRTNLARDWGYLNNQFNQEIDKHFVSSSALPGLWQASAFQTGTNKSGYFYRYGSPEGASGYTEENGIGASPYTSGSETAAYSNLFSINNGMDGMSTGYNTQNGWIQSNIASNYNDKIMLASSFETVHMGANKDGAITIGDSNYIEATSTFVNDDTNGEIRKGLWQLNGYDRTFNTNGLAIATWLRSGYSDTSYGNVARHISNRGSSAYGIVTTNYTVRPVLHLDLSNFSSAPSLDLDEANELITKASQPNDIYTNSSFNAFKSYVEGTLATLVADAGSGDITQEDIDTAVEEAKGLLVVYTAPNLIEAQLLIDKAGQPNSIYTTASFGAFKEYTEGTLTPLVSAVGGGDKDITQEDIDAVVTTAKGLLVLYAAPDLTEAQSLITKAGQPNSIYTTASFGAFKEYTEGTLTPLVSVVQGGNKDITQEDIDAVVTTAKGLLVVYAAPDIGGLEELIQRKDSLDTTLSGKYTGTSAEAFKTYIDEVVRPLVEAVERGDEVSQAEINEAVSNAPQLVPISADNPNENDPKKDDDKKKDNLLLILLLSIGGALLLAAILILIFIKRKQLIKENKKEEEKEKDTEN